MTLNYLYVHKVTNFCNRVKYCLQHNREKQSTKSQYLPIKQNTRPYFRSLIFKHLFICKLSVYYYLLSCPCCLCQVSVILRKVQRQWQLLLLSNINIVRSLQWENINYLVLAMYSHLSSPSAACQRGSTSIKSYQHLTLIVFR